MEAKTKKTEEVKRCEHGMPADHLCSICNKKHNGWTNYETWNVALHIDNEQSTQEYWRDRASNWLSISIASDLFTKEEQATLDLADELKEEAYDGLPDIQGFYMDILNAGLSEVNWYEIAKNLIEGLSE